MLDYNKIAFIVPPVSLNEIYGGLSKVGAVSPPLNLLLLAAIVRKNGYEPHIIDSPALGLSYKDVVTRLLRINPKYVGLTAMTPHIMQAGKLAKLIRENVPEALILLGGAHISSVPEETMIRFQEIDVGFIGEADYSLPEFLDMARQNNSNAVRGIIIRANGQLRKTDDRVEKITLDKLPFYAWDVLEGFPHVYTPPLFTTHRIPATPVLTSRGCSGKCIFCYSGCHKTISAHSAEYITEMLKYLKKTYKIKEFMIFDDNFVMHRQNLIKFLNLMITEKLSLTWSCNARVDMVDDKLLRLMAKAGCWQVSYGIETGSQEIMDRLEKNITIEKVQYAIEASRKAGIRTVGYFMLGHFGETQKTMQETIKFACDLGLDDFRLSFFTPLPGTKALRIADQYGELDNEWAKMNLFSPVFIPYGMKREQLIAEQKRMLRKFFFRPKVIFSYLKMIKRPILAIKGAYLFANYVLHRN
ncbi:B12-binding domain-containing radical SAM protein [Candidatus Magnetobacterium casense]|uniref:Radical SAM protein n=1 Tax=Candidatus Magnetobacterium casense TaxID=1455061 RepID=A0ABS6RVI6_9BACT|nr:radical SAM protein [Candidatus Magnetobacterium casensis]MBV6340637.1 radical SAM protein [Candidatus Magnetobacterium casensis]